MPRPFPLELLETVKPTLSCLGGHLHIKGDSEPSPVFLGEQATMDKTTRRFRDISVTLAESNVAGLHAQTVNYLLPASQHVLRMSCVPEDEAKRFIRHGGRPFLVTDHPTRCHLSPLPHAPHTWRLGYWLS